MFPLAVATMEGVDDCLEHTTCEECGSAIVVVLLSSGRALCGACAAIHFRIPSADPVVVKAEIRRMAGVVVS